MNSILSKVLTTMLLKAIKWLSSYFLNKKELSKIDKKIKDIQNEKDAKARAARINDLFR